MDLRKLSHRLISVGLVLVFAATQQLEAQPKPGYMPSSTHIFPAGGQRGTVVDVRVGAECIAPGTDFLVYGSGVEGTSVLKRKLPDLGELSPRRNPTEVPITYPRDWQARIKINDDAALQPIYWRLSSAQGGTGSRPFLIGDLPEFVESESNSRVNRAEQISLPVTVNGRICGERDVDYFRFAAKSKEVIVFDVMAGRIGSRLDPIVEILDQEGQRVNFQRINVGSDPVLAFAPERSGEYLLRVSNVTFRGDPSCVYRITISTKQYVPYVFPAGGVNGKGQEVQFFALSGKESVWLRTTHQIQLPKESLTFRYQTALANPILFSCDEFPCDVEREPNDSRLTATRVTIPQTIDGQHQRTADEDWFSFESKKGHQLALTCYASSNGTDSLPTMEIVDDQDQVLAKSLSVDSDDRVCRISWRTPANARYWVRIRDLQNHLQSGPQFAYRLTIREAHPDFRITFASDCLNVIQGKSAPIPLKVERLHGFDGRIDLRFNGLPKGVTIEPAVIEAKQKQVKVTIKATDDVIASNYILRVSGVATIEQTKVERVAVAKHLGTDGEGVSIGRAALDRIHLTVNHKPVFRLFCAEAYQYAHRGSVFQYPMQIERLNGFNGPVTLQIGDRQNRDLDGIQMFEVTIPPGKSDITLPIYLPETMHINIQSQSQLYCQARATFVDEHQQQQSVLILSEKRNMLRTRPPVVKLSAIKSDIKANRGEQVTLHLRLERTTNFPGPMRLTMRQRSPKDGFVLKPVLIAAGETEIRIQFQVPDEAKTGEQRLTFRAVGKLYGKIDVITEASIRLNVLQGAKTD